MLWYTLFLATLMSAHPMACPVGHPTVLQELLRSRAVVIGDVVAERPIADSGGDRGGWYPGTGYRVRVTEVLHGSVPDTLELFSETSSGAFPMVVGQRYLMFVYRNLGRYLLDYCGHSGPLPERSADAATVRRLVRELQPPN